MVLYGSSQTYSYRTYAPSMLYNQDNSTCHCPTEPAINETTKICANKFRTELEINCLIPDDCREYYWGIDYLFEVNPKPGAVGSHLKFTDYSWITSPLDLPNITFSNKIKIIPNDGEYGQSFIRLSSFLNDRYYISDTFLQL